MGCLLCGGRILTPVLYSRGGGGPSWTVTSTDRDFGRIVECRGCGLRFRDPRELHEVLMAGYQAMEDPRYAEQSYARLKNFQGALTRMMAVIPPSRWGSLLDVGCATGVFLDVAAAAGWPVIGVDPSRWAVKAAQAKGHQIHEGTLADYAGPKIRVVTMWDALEHFSDPLSELRRARRVTENGGYLVLTTMNEMARFPRLVGRRWPWYLRMHLTYWSPDTIRRALTMTGWEVTKITSYPHIVSWDYLGYKLLPGWAADRFSRALTWCGISCKTTTVDLGDFMTVYAEAR